MSDGGSFRQNIQIHKYKHRHPNTQIQAQAQKHKYRNTVKHLRLEEGGSFGQNQRLQCPSSTFHNAHYSHLHIAQCTLLITNLTNCKLHSFHCRLPTCILKMPHSTLHTTNNEENTTFHTPTTQEVHNAKD